MKALIFVEETSEEDLKFEDLQTLHQDLTDEICLGEDAQSDNELYKRYILAYNKLQRVKDILFKELNEHTKRKHIW